MKKIISTVLALSALPVMAFAGTAFAESPGQLATGANVYMVKNVTTGGSYASSANVAACGDVVQFSTELNNGGFGNLTNVSVKATLPTSSATSFSSTVTATSAEGSTTTGTATVNSSTAQTMSYVAGSTKLYSSGGTLIQTMPDTVNSTGVNVGTINGSTTEYLNFQAKLNCPTPTPVPTPTPTPTPTPVKPAARPAALPNTGPGEVAALFTGASAVGTAAHMVVSRRNRR